MSEDLVLDEITGLMVPKPEPLEFGWIVAVKGTNGGVVYAFDKSLTKAMRKMLASGKRDELEILEGWIP